MGADLRISQIDNDYHEGRYRVIYTEIDTIHDNDIIEELEQKGQQNWYLSSECGAIFELLGSEIIETFKKAIENNKENRLNQYYQADIQEIVEDEYYRCELCF